MHRRLFLMGAVLALAACAGTGMAATDDVLAKTDGDLVARIHFVGTAHIAADPKGASLKAIGALPVTDMFGEATLAKLATAPFRLLQHKVANHNTNDYADLLRPLLDDLLHGESYAEMRGPTNAVPEFMLAVQLSDERAALWEANLSVVVTNWTGIPDTEVQGDGYTGWELKKHHDPNVIRCLRAGDWLLFGWGWDELRLQPAFLQRIKEKKRPVEVAKENWLDVLVDWPALTATHPIALPGPFPIKLPKMHLTVQGRKDFIRPKLTMLFPEPLALKLDAWQFPTNSIHNLLVSFTAARGIAPLLGELSWVKEMHLDPAPNQFSVWAMSTAPFETRFALPVPDASNYLARFGPGMASEYTSNLVGTPVTMEVTWTNNTLVLSGMPFLSPYLRAVREPEADFLAGSIFPGASRSQPSPFPRDMMREILSKPNLVYYDWEINSERIRQWRSIEQMFLISCAIPIPNSGLAAQKWLMAATNLVTCGTEITLTAPNELTLVRNAPVGFTGFELNLLAYWLDAPGFPLEANYSRRPPPPVRR